MATIEDRWTRADKTRTPLYGKGLRWMVVWHEPAPQGRQRRKKSFANKGAAQAFLEDLQNDLYTGVYRPVSKKRMYLWQYAAQWEALQIHQRPASRTNIERRLRLDIIPTLGGAPLDDVTRAHVQDAVLDWADRLAASTVALTYSYLVSMFKAAVLDGHLAASPCVGIRLPEAGDEPVIPLDTATVQLITDTMDPTYAAMVPFAAATGLRGAEMRGLTWDRVDLTGGSVMIDRQLVGDSTLEPAWGPPKTRKGIRRISVGPATVALLDTLPRDGLAGLVFTNAKGRAITRRLASHAWSTMRQNHVPGAGDGWHQLRHHHASLLIAGGLSPVAVAHRLGHKDVVETLRTYSHLWNDDDDRAAVLSDGLITPATRCP